MTDDQNFEIFMTCAPGLESILVDEVRGKGFKRPKAVYGGVSVTGGWPDVWRANLWVRGAGRILARVDTFRSYHLAELDARARLVPWASVLRSDVPFRVEASCSKSKLYHSGAVAERIGRAISETLGAVWVQDDKAADDAVLVMARVDHDRCTVSVDTSGALLHKRGFKVAVNQAPMRETMASLFLRACGYDGREPVLDPMCGSGTFVIEAAEIALRLNPGRERQFAFERLATFDSETWEKMRNVMREHPADLPRFYGSDRDAGAIDMSRANAERAGVLAFTQFDRCVVSDLVRPSSASGLVIVNPPYGARIGEKKMLFPLYRALGRCLRERFSGWRVGLVTTESALAQATELSFLPEKVTTQHGGLRVSLFRTEPIS